MISGKDIVSGEALSCLAEAHWRAVGNGSALRNIAKRQVTRVCYDSRTFIVKTYRLGILRRLLGLRVRAFDFMDCLAGLTPPCVCDCVMGDWQFAVFEDAGKNNLFYYDYQVPDDASTLGHFAEAGMLLAEMHRRNVFHGDTKSPNFVINENCHDLPPVVIVDCDNVRQYKELPVMKAAFNLAQFIESGHGKPPVESLVSHFGAFCDAYKDAAGLDEPQWKHLFLLAMDIAENNRHIERRTKTEAIIGLKKQQGVE